MNLPWPERIGVRLALAVAGVLVLLAVVTYALTSLAFERAARSVQEASVVELERSARHTLQEITEREAQVIANSLEQYAAAGRTAADYLARALEAAAADADPSSTAGSAAPLMVQASSGHWLDPDPARRTTLHVPSQHAQLPSSWRDATLTRPLDAILPVLFPALPDAVGIFFSNPHGVVRYHPPIDLSGLVEPDFDVTVQPVFQLGTPTANPEGLTRWTPPYPDDAGNGLLVTVVTPVYAGGTFRGVVDIDVALDRLAARLTQLSPLPESFALLVDAEGRLITAAPGATRLLGYPDDLPFGARLDSPRLDGLLARMLEGDVGTTVTHETESAVVVSHAALPGIGWTLAIGAPVSAVASPARQIADGIAEQARLARQVSAVVGLLMFLLALGVLVLATRRWVVRPISRLVAGTRRLSEGELGVTFTVGSAGEFRVLGEAFNRMSRAIAHQRREILDHQRDLERQVAERTRDLGNLFAISSDLSAAPDAPSLLRAVLERLHDAVPFGSGSVWLMEAESLRRLTVVTRTEGEAADSAALPLSVLEGSLERLASGRQVRLTHADESLPTLFEPASTNVLLAPLTYRGRLLGVLALAEPALDETHQLELVGAVAQQLGTALENARLLLEARERSALEERQHLARELHDSVSQALFGIVLGLGTALREIDGPGRLRSSVEYASELADAALKEMRALIFELRPEALESEGLVGLLGRQAEMLRARHELDVALEVVEPPLPISAKAVLYRVAQEALHNVVKHAQAGSVRVTLEHAAGNVRLEVCDDGRGFMVGTQGMESYGLHSMRERMALLGGRLEVVSASGAGTRVLAGIPLAGSAEPGTAAS